MPIPSPISAAAGIKARRGCWQGLPRTSTPRCHAEKGLGVHVTHRPDLYRWAPSPAMRSEVPACSISNSAVPYGRQPTPGPGSGVLARSGGRRPPRASSRPIPAAARSRVFLPGRHRAAAWARSSALWRLHRRPTLIVALVRPAQQMGPGNLDLKVLGRRPQPSTSPSFNEGGALLHWRSARRNRATVEVDGGALETVAPPGTLQFNPAQGAPGQGHALAGRAEDATNYYTLGDLTSISNIAI